MRAHPRPLVVGFVGSIGCGKTLRSTYLATLFDDNVPPHLANVPSRIQDTARIRAMMPERPVMVHIDCDKVGHKTYEPGTETYTRVVQHFGKRVLCPFDTEHGDSHPKIDRKALGSIVFADKEELQALNAIVWPAIARDVDAQISDACSRFGASACVLVEGALLIELSAIATECDALWFYTADRETAIARVVNRDGLDREAVERRMSAQHPLEQRVKEAEHLPHHDQREIHVFDTSNDSVNDACAKAVDALAAQLSRRAGN